MHKTWGQPQVPLQFGSKEDLKSALEIIFQKTVPFLSLERFTIVVPPEACALFDHLSYEECEVTSAGDLAPDEIAELRREYLGFPA